MSKRRRPWYWPPGMPWWSCRGGGRSIDSSDDTSPIPPTPPSPPVPPVVVEQLDVVVPPSSFVSDVRSAYDGAIGGTLAGSFFAIAGRGAVPDRVFWWTQSDGVTQQGQDPTNWIPELAGFTAIQVQLDPGLVTSQDVAIAVQLAMAAFPEYEVTQIGPVPTASWQFRIRSSQIDAAASFTGADYPTRGQAGIWGIHVATILGTGFDGEGPATSCNAQYAQAPLLGSTRVLAMDVYVGTLHAVGSQFRLALYEGGGAVDPTGAVLLYDFGQISGIATNQWVRVWVDPASIVAPGNGSNLWLTLKNNAAGTNVAGFFTGSPWNGDLADQDFWQSASMSADPTAPYEAVFTAGGAHGSTFILGLRLIYDSAPYVGDGSLRRRFGVHEDASVAPNSASIDSQLLMSAAAPPQILGLELDSVWMPYGDVHSDAGGQFRLGVAQGGTDVDTPNGAVQIADVGQTSGNAVDAYVVVAAPGPGASAVAIDIAQPIRWWAKNNNTALGASEIGFSNPGAVATISPPDNPMDWPLNGVNTNPEYEIFPPQCISDPTVAFEAAVPATTIPPDATPGNYPVAAVELRVNGIDLIASIV